MISVRRCSWNFLALVVASLLSMTSMAETLTFDPPWERSAERYTGYYAEPWWKSSLDGTPNVTYYGSDNVAWSWPLPVASTWPSVTNGINWFYTLEGPSSATSWFRVTLPAQPGKKLVGFTLTSADRPGTGIGINDGIYVFVDGQFTGAWASVSAWLLSGHGNPAFRGTGFPTDWYTPDLYIAVGDTASTGHEIAVAFEEDFGWGGLTRLRIIGVYEDMGPVDGDGDGVADDADTCLGTSPGAPVLANGCSVEQQCACSANWKNHGHYVRCVSHTAEELWASGVITPEQKAGYVSAAARSACGK